MNELNFGLELVHQTIRWSQPLLAAEPSMLESWGTFLYNILLVALGLGFVIFVHELGHFLAAKAFGVQCDKFYVGFDVPISIGPIKLPAKLFHFQWGETEYGIGMIPLGGYVKMLGQDDDPRNAAAEAERAKTASDEPNQAQLPSGAGALNPRSYLAKSVFARMVIISAGVIMNIITGVLMAAVAFYIGVPYDVPVLGSVIPGDPAWHAGMEPGDRIVKAGKMESEELSFRDMQQSIIFAGIRDAEKPIDFRIDRNGEMIDMSVVGTTRHGDPSLKGKIVSLGFRASSVTKAVSSNPISKQYIKDSAFSEAELTPLKPGDIILGINGETLPLSKHSDAPLSFELEQRLEPRHNESVTLRVSRLKDPANPKTSEREEIDVVSPPMPMKSVGLGFLPGPVVGVQANSVAAEAGITNGMKLVAWDGKPIVDSFAFMLDIATKHGQSTSVEFEDGAGNKKSLQWQVPENFPITLLDGFLAPSGLEIPGSGVVFEVSNVVGAIDAGLPAAKAGIQVGDKVTQIQLQPVSEEDASYFSEVFRGAGVLKDAHPVDQYRNMQYWITLMQSLRTGMPLDIYVERDGKVNNSRIQIAKDTNRTWPDRGFVLNNLTRTHHVGNFGDALSLGTHEIVKRGKSVLDFLGMLVTGKMPFRFVGGPGAIAVEATDAASKGISPLLMFLTMLSANLAIINFLPIPALDGGHMLFLIIEAIIGRPVDEELEGKLRMIGVLGLLTLMAAVIFNDVINFSRFFGG